MNALLHATDRAVTDGFARRRAGGRVATTAVYDSSRAMYERQARSE
jgi:hypothetical protein